MDDIRFHRERFIQAFCDFAGMRESPPAPAPANVGAGHLDPPAFLFEQREALARQCDWLESFCPNSWVPVWRRSLQEGLLDDDPRYAELAARLGGFSSGPLTALRA